MAINDLGEIAPKCSSSALHGTSRNTQGKSHFTPIEQRRFNRAGGTGQ